MLEDLAHPGETFLDPRAWRCLKDLVTTAPQSIQFFFQGVDLAFRVEERLREGPAAAAFADEVDEMGEAPFLGGELRFLEPDRLGDMRVERGDFGLDPVEEVFDVLGVGEVRTDGVEDEAFDETAPYEQCVLAGSLRCGEAAVVAAALPAHLGDRGAALPADHRTRQQMRWEVLLAGALGRGEAAPPRPTGPGAADVGASSPHLFPQRVRHDPQRRVLVDDPLGGRFGEGPSASCAGIAPEFAFVPDPAADIFFVVQEAAHGRGGPAVARAPAAGHRVGVQHADDAEDGVARGVGFENAQDGGRFARLEFEFVAVRPRPAFLVHARRADGDGAVPIGVLTGGEAALLLADLAAQGLLFQILELQLVKDAADLNAEGGLLIVAVEPVGHRNDPHAGEVQVGEDGEHEVVVAGEAGEIVDEDKVKGPVLAGHEQASQRRAVFARARLRFVGVEMVVEDGKAALGGQPAAGGDLIGDAFGTLILGAVASVDSGTHHESSGSGGRTAAASCAASSIRRTYSRASSSAR